MRESKPGPVCGCLLDIEGVLVRDKRFIPLPGAVAWVEGLIAAGVPFCLVSNNTTFRPNELVSALVGVGFAVGEDHLVGALGLGVRWLRERSRQRLLWLGTPHLDDYWREMGFTLVKGDAAATADTVVLGVNPALQVADLDRALPALLDTGADLLCLHRNSFYLDDTGRRRLGPGTWAAGLAALGARGRVETVGKPSPTIYTEALDRIGVAAAEALFISDDPVADLVTAGKLGMTTAFVLSGKHDDHTVLGQLPAAEWPDIICDGLADLELPKRVDN